MAQPRNPASFPPESHNPGPLKIMKQPLVQDFRTPDPLTPCTIVLPPPLGPARPPTACLTFHLRKSCLVLVRSSSPLPQCATHVETGFGGNVVMRCRVRIVTAMVRLCVCVVQRHDKPRQATTRAKRPRYEEHGPGIRVQDLDARLQRPGPGDQEHTAYQRRRDGDAEKESKRRVAQGMKPRPFFICFLSPVAVLSLLSKWRNKCWAKCRC